ncbi:hypothetical protein CRUP_030594, partial [Coryphaenoides rupestris]
VIMNSRTSFPPPVSRDRVITQYPKAYSPQASLQLKTDWSSQTKVSSQDRAARNQPWDRQKMSKAVVVGDQGVGKTCLINRFCKDVFHRDYKATIGVDFEIERFEVAGIPFSLQIWDTAGQEKFKCIASAYYRGAQGSMSCYGRSTMLLTEGSGVRSMEERQRTEQDATKMAAEMARRILGSFCQISSLWFEYWMNTGVFLT